MCVSLHFDNQFLSLARMPDLCFMFLPLARTPDLSPWSRSQVDSQILVALLLLRALRVAEDIACCDDLALMWLIESYLFVSLVHLNLDIVVVQELR